MTNYMKAAVVRSFDAPPRYQDYAVPMDLGPDEALVDVLAAALHRRVRSQASGSHYTSTDQLPLVPGVDGVGRLADGQLVYFVLPDTRLGSMAEQTVIDVRRSVALPDDADVALMAAGMNPAMSSWLALKRRIDFQPGQSVLVLGATGSSGQLAMKVAEHLGAGKVMGAGRNSERITGFEAHELDDLACAAGVDVVLDYLWGAPAEEAMVSLVKAMPDPSKPLHWVQIGSVAGAAISLRSEVLRAANLRILGSGQGSVSTRGILEELPEIARTLTALDLPLRAVPLSAVETTWADTSAERVVLIP